MGYIPHPVEVEYTQASSALRIKYSDDFEAVYPTALLRGYCPCAHCQGHGAGPPKWNPIRTSAAIRIDDVHQVGNYAMCIVWGDGHDTGIYSFEYLRAIKPDPDFDPNLLEPGDPLDIDYSL